MAGASSQQVELLGTEEAGLCAEAGGPPRPTRSLALGGKTRFVIAASMLVAAGLAGAVSRGASDAVPTGKTTDMAALQWKLREAAAKLEKAATRAFPEEMAKAKREVKPRNRGVEDLAEAMRQTDALRELAGKPKVVTEIEGAH